MNDFRKVHRLNQSAFQRNLTVEGKGRGGRCERRASWDVWTVLPSVRRVLSHTADMLGLIRSICYLVLQAGKRWSEDGVEGGALEKYYGMYI